MVKERSTVRWDMPATPRAKTISKYRYAVVLKNNPQKIVAEYGSRTEASSRVEELRLETRKLKGRELHEIKMIRRRDKEDKQTQRARMPIPKSQRTLESQYKSQPKKVKVKGYCVKAHTRGLPKKKR